MVKTFMQKNSVSALYDVSMLDSDKMELDRRPLHVDSESLHLMHKDEDEERQAQRSRLAYAPFILDIICPCYPIELAIVL